MIYTLKIREEVNSKITSETATTRGPSTSTAVSHQPEINQRRQEGKIEE